MVEILKMKFDQDLCLNLQYDFGKMNSTLGSVVPLAMFSNLGWFSFSLGPHLWWSQNHEVRSVQTQSVPVPCELPPGARFNIPFNYSIST